MVVLVGNCYPDTDVMGAIPAHCSYKQVVHCINPFPSTISSMGCLEFGSPFTAKLVGGEQVGFQCMRGCAKPSSPL